MVAEELVRKGMLEDAIKLYDIANVSSDLILYLIYLHLLFTFILRYKVNPCVIFQCCSHKLYIKVRKKAL